MQQPGVGETASTQQPITPEAAGRRPDVPARASQLAVSQVQCAFLGPGQQVNTLFTIQFTNRFTEPLVCEKAFVDYDKIRNLISLTITSARNIAVQVLTQLSILK